MVRFEEKKVVIEIETRCSPVEYWQELQKGLLDLLCNTNCDNITDEYYIVPDFLRELIPEWAAVKKMQSE